jgi:hypothetical protein
MLEETIMRKSLRMSCRLNEVHGDNSSVNFRRKLNPLLMFKRVHAKHGGV